jgi:putative flippase GtrA
VNSVTMFIAVDALGVHVLGAKLAAATCTFVTNFLLRRCVLFTPLRV